MDASEISVPGVTLHKDGSITRTLTNSPYDQQIEADSSFFNGVASKDVVLNDETNLWARLFLPEAAASVPDSPLKLPIVVFFHGGGYVIWSAACLPIHRLCSELATTFQVLVLSVEYRLAPEHRLPAAFEDGFAALQWLQQQACATAVQEPWLHSYADFSNCFLYGSSAGGGIVHQVALTAAGSDLSPLKLRGLVLEVPYFGGEARTASESSARGSLFSPEVSDAFWALSLPQGAKRDHPFCYVVGEGAPKVDALEWPPTMVIVGGRDMLHDRQIEYVEALRKAEKEAILLKFEEREHDLTEEFRDKQMEEVSEFIEKHKS